MPEGQHGVETNQLCGQWRPVYRASGFGRADAAAAAGRVFVQRAGSTHAFNALAGWRRASQFSYSIAPVCGLTFSRCTSELSTVTTSAVIIPSSLLTSPIFSRLVFSRSSCNAR